MCVNCIRTNIIPYLNHNKNKKKNTKPNTRFDPHKSIKSDGRRLCDAPTFPSLGFVLFFASLCVMCLFWWSFLKEVFFFFRSALYLAAYLGARDAICDKFAKNVLCEKWTKRLCKCVLYIYAQDPFVRADESREQRQKNSMFHQICWHPRQRRAIYNYTVYKKKKRKVSSHLFLSFALRCVLYARMLWHILWKRMCFLFVYTKVAWRKAKTLWRVFGFFWTRWFSLKKPIFSNP